MCSFVTECVKRSEILDEAILVTRPRADVRAPLVGGRDVFEGRALQLAQGLCSFVVAVDRAMNVEARFAPGRARTREAHE